MHIIIVDIKMRHHYWMSWENSDASLPNDGIGTAVCFAKCIELFKATGTRNKEQKIRCHGLTKKLNFYYKACFYIHVI